MRSIRVLVANQPRLMRELVMATIADQPDIEIVGEVDDESEIVLAVERNHPDFVIIAQGRSRGLPSVCEPILQSYPETKVLVLPSLRSNSFMFYRTACRVEGSRIEASERGILGVLRGKAQPAARPQ